MTKYQLIYNGGEHYPLCDTLEEAEMYKKNASEQWPEIKVEIKKQEEQHNVHSKTRYKNY
jgi:hypothetical protein